MAKTTAYAAQMAWESWRKLEETSVAVVLAVTRGPYMGRSYTFDSHQTFVAGRSSRAHLLLPSRDRSVSRYHFLIEVNPPDLRLCDMGSRNGTYVNGKRVTSTNLKHGDRIEAGETALVVSVGDLAQVAPGQGEPPTQFEVREGQAEAAEGKGRTEDLHSGGGEPSKQCQPAQPTPLKSDGARGKQIRGYQLIRELGRGAMGVVYLATRSRDGAVVAMKTIMPAVAASRVQMEKFLREARVLKSLDHPNIVSFEEMGQEDSTLYFTMEFVPGKDAAQILREVKVLDARRACALICQVLDALGYAHEMGYVHRDVKPANVLVMSRGGAEMVKVADFGLARVYHASRLSGLTLLGEVGGSIGFMPPEQILNYREVTPAGDQYGAAATLYHLLTGRYVFDFPDDPRPELLLKVVLEREPIPLASRRRDLAPLLGQAIHRALAKEPGDRFKNVKDFRTALAPFAG